jgi:hypothetical protein
MADRLTAEQRQLRGRVGGFTLHARQGADANLPAAREAFLRKFVDQVDPGRTLPEEERERRAASARKAYFTQLAYRSSISRSRRSERGARGQGGQDAA